MTVHMLKTWPEPFDAIKSGLKRFEVRRNDRCFQSGDIVRLQRTHNNYRHLIDSIEPMLEFRIGWMLQGGQFGIEPGYCVFQLEDI